MQQPSFAQTYQMGSLEDAYATDPKKVLANFALLLVFALLAPPIVLTFSHTTADSIPLIIASFLVVGGGVLLGLYLYYRQLQVSVSTNGLLYLNGN